jgi:hypothetical protein
MKVMITETTVVSYEVDVPLAKTSSEAARIARAAFREALDTTSFHHSVALNTVEYTVLGQGVPRTFVDEQMDQ